MDDERFEPRLGRMRSSASRGGRKYLHRALAAAARAGAHRARPGRPFGGGRIGRGSVAARLLGDPQAAFRVRRAVIKTRLVRLGGNGLGSAQAHLRYIQRDGVTREGEPGRLYSAADDGADGKAFLERSAGDRHQFRLIVSAEDGDQYDDLRPLIRRFMARMEEDLGTKLDWVAADHVDTLHPHTHIMLRGRDEEGGNLVIAPDYIKAGMRKRLAGLVSIDLGPRTDLEIARRRRLDVGAERLTALDRRLLREAGSSRTVEARGRDMADRALRTGRLRKLAALGLAEDLGGGWWRLAQDLEPTLRRLGEQGDIIRTMQRALTAAGLERAAEAIHGPGNATDVTGRVVERGLADELGDRHYLIVDGIDGRSHFVEIGRGDATEDLPAGAIVRITTRSAAVRETDRRIAGTAAANDGRYSVELQRAMKEGASGGVVLGHVRRLEALRRKDGGPERLDDGSWSIPPNVLERARRYEALRSREAPVEVELLSPLPLEQLAGRDGATWLDRELVSPDALPRDQGFGREVRSALAARRAWLLEQGLAKADGERASFGPDLLGRLQHRELSRVASAIARDTGMELAPAHSGATVEGMLRRRLDLASGRFAMIDNGREFMLVPWRPVLERAIGRAVAGRVRKDGGISWTIGRDRGLEVG